jgi:hypothetical protein
MVLMSCKALSTILDWWKGALKIQAHILLTFYPLRLGICICGGCTLIPFLPYLFCLATSFEDSFFSDGYGKHETVVNRSSLAIFCSSRIMNIEHPIHHLRQKDTQILHAKHSTFWFICICLK